MEVDKVLITRSIPYVQLIRTHVQMSQETHELLARDAHQFNRIPRTLTAAVKDKVRIEVDYETGV